MAVKNTLGWILAGMLAACGGDKTNRPTSPDSDVSQSHSASWSTPSCSVIRGVPGVTFTRDDGETVAALPEPAKNTKAVVVLDIANHLLALKDNRLLLSRDSGCQWEIGGVLSIGELSQIHLLAPAPGGRVYGERWG